MKILFSLLKIDLVNSLSLNTLFTKKKKSSKQKGSKLLGLLLIYILLAALIIFYTVMFSIMIAQSGNNEVIITLGAGMGGMLCLIMTLGQSYGTLFQSKDFELLATLPIDKKIIVTSKLLSLLIMNYIYFNIPFLTSVVMYSLFDGFELYYILSALLGALLGPLLAVTVCSICAFLLGRLLSGFKYKNLLTSIVSVGFIILVFAFSFNLSSMESEMPEEEFLKVMVENIQNVFSKTYFVSNFLSQAFNGDLIYLLWFVIVSVVPFSLFVYITAKNYVRINANQKTGYKAKKFKLEEQKNSGQFKALLKKEAKIFFSTNVYFMNVIVSPLLSTIMLITISLSFNEEGMSLSEISHMFPLIFTILLLFIMGMMSSSSSSISMEGKQFWILKSAPVSIKTVLFVKSLLNVLLCAPFILINTVITIIMYDCSIVDSIVMGLTILFAICAYSMVGVWINLVNHKLDWDNPAQVIKSSSTTLIAMLSSFVMDIILGIPIIISFVMQLYNPFLVCITALLLALAAYYLLFNNGVKRFNAIEV